MVLLLQDVPFGKSIGGNPSGNPSDLCGIYVEWNLWLGDRIFWFYGTFMEGNWINDIQYGINMDIFWDNGIFMAQWRCNPFPPIFTARGVTMVDVGDET